MLQKREKGGDCTCSSVSFFGGGPTNAFGFGSAPSSAQPASTTCESQLKEATLLIFRPRTILCNKGDNCKYSHVMPGQGTNNNPQMSSQVGGGGWNDSFDSSANNNNTYYVYRGGIKNNPVNSLLKENADLELRVTSKIRMTFINTATASQGFGGGCNGSTSSGFGNNRQWYKESIAKFKYTYILYMNCIFLQY